MPGKIPAKHNPFGSADAVGLLDFTFGDELSNARIVSIQAKDVNGRNVAQRVSFPMYLSDDPNGDDLTATAVTALAGGTNGFLIELVAEKAGRLVTEADGTVDISVTFTGGADTWYVCCVMPDGSLIVSDALTFAA